MIPREILFGNPEAASPKLSPDGKRLAFLAPSRDGCAPEGGVLNLWLAEKPQAGAKASPVTKDRGRGIRAYFWAEDNRSLIYLQDKDGDENWHLYQADVETKTVRDLTPFPGAQAQALATDPKKPHEFLAAVNARDKRLHDVYRINLKTGAALLDAENPGDVAGWLADSNLEVRACTAQLPDGSSQLRVRDEAGAPWRALITWGPDEQGGAHAFAPGNEHLYVESSLGSDTTRLLRVAIQDGAQEELFRHEEVDVGPLVLHPTAYRLQAVGYDLARLKWRVVDAGVEEDFRTIEKIDDGEFRIVSRTDADDRWIVLYDCADKAPRYYLYDRAAKKADLLMTTRPALEKYELGRKSAVEIRARDGLTLRGYLTLPPEGDGKNLPLVLNVHGGPWARDHWGYHSEVLWLADRGYAVLQVNYRSSTGYGKKFLHAGDREWGAKMQDDLTDAVHWAIEKGIADPKRVAIYGGSYGGYAALAGAAFTPDVYACAVDIVGPSSLETLIRSIPPYWELMRRIFDLRVGDVDKEPDFLRGRSPLFSADKIKIPMLIAQGANDPRTKQAESEQIVKVLREKGKEVQYMLFPDEGHGFARPENRLKFYESAENFLARHMGN